MASAQRPVVHQDYIARVRYSNALPPPPNPPKLLDIPGTGLAGGQYTSAGYASRLAREQPLNIEADAELGMPIDLIGLPGVFDGDESEYTASQNVQHFSSSTAKDLNRAREEVKRRKASANKEDPINIMRNIIKGFDLAYPHDAYRGEDSTTNLRGADPTAEDRRAWSTPTHPTNSKLKLLESYPVLPDLEAIPTTGFYMVMKLAVNPLISGAKHDERLATAILRPVNDPAAEASYQQKLSDWNPDSVDPEPIREYDYDYFLPVEESAVRGIKRKFNVNDPDNDDPELYADSTETGERMFKFTRIRTYETQNQHGDANNVYNDSVALALHDPATAGDGVAGAKKRLQKGAYFYPIVQRTSLRPKRTTRILSQTDEPKVDELNVTVADMDEASRISQLEKQAAIDPTVTVPEITA